jgi:hypothetical protein
MAHDQEVVGSNPGMVNRMDVSLASYYFIEKYGNKGSQMGHTKTNILKIKIFIKPQKDCTSLTLKKTMVI